MLTPMHSHVQDVVHPYEIDNSALLSGGFLKKTPGTVMADRAKHTFSWWEKGVDTQSNNYRFYAGDADGNPRFEIRSYDGYFDVFDGPYDAHKLYYRFSTSVIADFTSWRHVVVAIDTGHVEPSMRVRAWINGKSIPLSISTAVAQNYQLSWGGAWAHRIGAYKTDVPVCDFYLTEVNYVNGQSLEPSAFGQFSNVIPSLWIPKGYTGSYGTSGFSLNFADAANLGKDVSGNSNGFTVNGSPVQTMDTPTNNYMTFNPLRAGENDVLSSGNLTVAANASAVYYDGALPTFGVSKGKYYGEFTCDVHGHVETYFGMAPSDHAAGAMYPGGDTSHPGLSLVPHGTEAVLLSYIGGVGENLTLSSVPKAGDTYGIAIDLTEGKLWVSHNGSWIGGGDPEASLTPTRSFTPYDVELGWACVFYTNTSNRQYTLVNGATGFKYAQPAGYKTLCSRNLPDPEIINPATGHEVVLYQGSGAAQNIRGLQHQPDLVIQKRCDAVDDWDWVDSVRGATKTINSNQPTVEATDAAGLTEFLLDGFSLGSSASVNTSGSSNLAISLKRGPEFGFDIIKYTGNGVAGRQIVHNCGGLPEMVIVKGLSVAQHWWIYHHALGPTKYLVLNLPNASTASAADDLWNHTEPTATDVTLGGRATVNGVGEDYVMYVFRSVPGFSKVFSYSGNNSVDGPFIHLGFRPKLWFIKNSSNSSMNWILQDTRSDPVNGIVDFRLMNTNAVPQNATPVILATSNGMKITYASSGWNLTGLHVGIAWADQPSKYSNAF